MRISISDVQDILSVIGEEDSIGLDHDRGAQIAISTLQNKIQKKLDSGELREEDILISDE